jgi:N-succinyldiaminopimelate aminotransferase
MNPGMHALHPYPFEKLAQLTTGVECPNKDRISLTIGEPKHQPPAHVLEALFNSLNEVSRYPTIGGLPELRQHIALGSKDALTRETSTPLLRCCR